jgi:phosphoglucomutase/phosphomannomutase
MSVNAAEIPNLTPAARAALNTWLTDPAYARWRPATEAVAASGNAAEINDAFGQEISFGTGGLRGRCGPGPGRMNSWVIAKATQGLADYLKAKGAAKSVVIGYDVRKDSREFAETTARVLAANGITVHFTDGLCSTPQLSYSVPHLKAGAGVMITASHNPPADNGYKCYQSNGCQFVAPEDDVLVSCVGKAVAPAESSLPTFADATARGRIVKVPDAVHAAFVAASTKASRAGIPGVGDTRVLYTPYHGCGITAVYPVLQKAGFAVRVLDAQARSDPNFPTLPGGVANPEEPATFKLALEAATPADDLILSSDPDADRIGALVRKTPGGEWVYLKGNQIAALLCDYIVRRWKAADAFHRGVVARTIVTTDLIDRIAANERLDVVNDLLVGFKYIGRVIDGIKAAAEIGSQATGEIDIGGGSAREFVFGGEESHGYLSGTHCLDKDAANAGCIMAAVVAEQKAAGRTAWQRLMELYRTHGLLVHGLVNLNLTPADGGLARAGQILAKLREQPPATLAGRPVLKVIDYQKGVKTTLDRKTGAKTTAPTDPGSVLVYVLGEDGADRITLRPSGTEPKMKLYGQLGKPVPAGADDQAVEALIASTEAELNSALTAAMKDFKAV